MLLKLAFSVPRWNFGIKTKTAPNLPNFLLSVVHLVLCGSVQGGVCSGWRPPTLKKSGSFPMVLVNGNRLSKRVIASQWQPPILRRAIALLQQRHNDSKLTTLKSGSFRKSLRGPFLQLAKKQTYRTKQLVTQEKNADWNRMRNCQQVRLT